MLPQRRSIVLVTENKLWPVAKIGAAAGKTRFKLKFIKTCLKIQIN